MVSIPHRYDQNFQLTEHPHLLNGFQFLIGTIKTCERWWCLSFRIRFNSSQVRSKLYNLSVSFQIQMPFQFLIGTIKTIIHSYIDYGMRYLFQFLIGTIKTYNNKISIIYFCIVSIPHRYDQNAGIEVILQIWENGFNSSQVRSKPVLGSALIPLLWGFNSSQVRSKRELNIIAERYSERFNSSQVRSKRMSACHSAMH